MEYEFIKPSTLKEACELLKNDGYRALAGGTDLVVKIRSGFFKALKGVVYIGDFFSKEIKKENGKIIIGSGCTMDEISSNKIIREYCPTLAEAASSVGATQIRQMATLGGNVGNASPAGDTIPALFSLEADVVITNGEEKHKIAISQFFTGPGRCKLQPGELIDSFEIPERITKGKFMKLGERSALAISKINLALSTWKDSNKAHYRVAIGSVAPTVIRCEKAEEILETAQLPLTDEIIAKASEAAKEAAKPISDIRSTSAYRKQMAGVLLRKACEALRE